MKKTQIIDFYLIGIGNAKNPSLSTELMHLIQGGTYFSGGKRHYELVKNLLPTEHQWIPIQGKMEALMERYQIIKMPILVFVSGDPFFYGFGNTLKCLLPEAKLKAYPFFNCLQLLCHKEMLAYNDLVTVSLHGRSWEKLDALMRANPSLIGILTDAQHSPAHIARRLMAHHFTNYKLLVGENLGGEDEKVTSLSLEEACTYTAAALNCVLLIQTESKVLPLAQPDHSFETLEGRPKMITKLPIRLLNIQLLQLHEAKTFWDLGSCTGAVAITAKQHYPHLEVWAIERRLESETIIHKNIQQQQTAGIHCLIGDFFDLNLSQLPMPQAVFIGGHGGRLEELINYLDAYLPKGARLVMNTVLENSRITFETTVTTLGYHLYPKTKLTIDQHNTIHVLVAKKI